MNRPVDLDELLQQKRSRRGLFRNAGVAGIGLSALPDLVRPPATFAAQGPTAPASTPKIGVVKNGVGNVPQPMVDGSSTLHPKQSKPETAFYTR